MFGDMSCPAVFNRIQPKDVEFVLFLFLFLVLFLRSGLWADNFYTILVHTRAVIEKVGGHPQIPPKKMTF